MQLLLVYVWVRQNVAWASQQQPRNKAANAATEANRRGPSSVHPYLAPASRIGLPKVPQRAVFAPDLGTGGAEARRCYI